MIMIVDKKIRWISSAFGPTNLVYILIYQSYCTTSGGTIMLETKKTQRVVYTIDLFVDPSMVDHWEKASWLILPAMFLWPPLVTMQSHQIKLICLIGYVDCIIVLYWNWETKETKTTDADNMRLALGCMHEMNLDLINLAWQ
jgi:hypothetical protein